MDAPVVRCRDHTQRYQELRRLAKEHGRRARAGSRGPAAKVEESQPPLGWVSAVAKVEHAEGVIKGLLVDLERYQNIHLVAHAEFGAEDDIEGDPEEKMRTTTADIQKMFKTLDKALKAVVRDADDQNILMNVHKGIVHRINQLYIQYNAIQSKYTAALEKKHHMSKKLTNIMESEATKNWEAEEERECRKDKLQELGYDKYQIESILLEEAIQKEKTDAIKDIGVMVEELHNMFSDLNTLVHEQGEMLDRIDENVCQTRMNMQQATAELRMANKTALSPLLPPPRTMATTVATTPRAAGTHAAAISDHYRSLGSSGSYERAWFYNDRTPYQYWLAREVAGALGLPRNGQAPGGERVLDVGCGTGNFSRLLWREGAGGAPIVGVDPFLEDGDDAVREGMFRVKATADEFIEELSPAAADIADASSDADPDTAHPVPTTFNKVLMKEMVHHIDGSFDGIARVVHTHFTALAATGRAGAGVDECALVIVTRPYTATHFPFFEAAAAAWTRGMMDPAACAARLERAGFRGPSAGVAVTERAYPVELPLREWKQMVRARFWSNFHDFDDAEIEDALAAMERAGGFDRFVVPGDEEGDDRVVRFEDRLIFIKAYVRVEG